MTEYENLPDEQEVIRRVQNGDREAFAMLVEFYQTKLRSVLSFYCSSSDMVEEFVQDSFVQAFLSISKFSLGNPFFPWLKTIAMNKLRKAARHREVRIRKADDYLYHLQMERAHRDTRGEVAEEHGVALQRCLSKLEATQVELLKKKYMDQVSLDELADMYDRSAGALKVQLHRLRMALKDCMEQQLAEGV